MIQCLVTDFGRVLGTFQQRIDVVRNIAQACGAECRNGHKLHEIFAVDALMSEREDLYYEALDTGRCDLAEVWMRFLSCYKLKKQQCPYETFKRHWCCGQQMILPVIEVFREIQERYPLVGISNGDKESLKYFAELLTKEGGLRFHRLYLSAFRYKKKPELFDAAAEELSKDGLPPRTCLYIDDILLYVSEARRRNFRAFHFDSTSFGCFEQAAQALRGELVKRGLKL